MFIGPHEKRGYSEGLCVFVCVSLTVRCSFTCPKLYGERMPCFTLRQMEGILGHFILYIIIDVFEPVIYKLIKLYFVVQLSVEKSSLPTVLQ